MRVLHVTDCYLPDLGGIELHVRDLAAAQRDRGLETLVLTATPGADDAGDDRVRRSGDVARTLAQWRPDVVHTHLSGLSPLATRGTALAARAGVPTVATAHSLMPPAPLLRMAGAAMGLSRWPVLWTAVSARALDSWRPLVGDRAQLGVLPNAVDVAWWRAGATSPQPGPPPGAARDDGERVVVSVMRLAPRKRPVPLLKVLRDVRRELPAGRTLRAYLVGGGPERTELQRLIRRWDLGDQVHLTGPLDRTAIRTLLASSHLFVAPATLESFGIAALEARSVGLPVVASSRGGVGEFVTHGVDGLLAADDRGLARSLTRLASDDVLLAAMTGHNRAHPPAYDWASAHERTLSAYDRATAIAAAPRSRVRTLTAVSR
jgi:glycosyltransferase involved in cell wall biosynthesis